MKTSILLAAGAAALLVGVPAAFAQDYAPTGASPPVAATPSPQGNWTLKQREDWLNDRINKAHDEHDIDAAKPIGRTTR